jgi:hypothetical protein
MSWLEAQSDESLDAVPDLDGNYRSNVVYGSLPQLDAWIKEDIGTPTWRMVTGPCVGHVRVHLGEVQALRQVLRSRVTT